MKFCELDLSYLSILFLEYLLQRAYQSIHMIVCTTLPHDANTPDFSGKSSQATTDFDIKMYLLA